MKEYSPKQDIQTNYINLDYFKIDYQILDCSNFEYFRINQFIEDIFISNYFEANMQCQNFQNYIKNSIMIGLKTD